MTNAAATGTEHTDIQIVSEDDVVRVEDLRLSFYTSLGVVRALNGVSFNIPRGKVLGVVGESGCGKSQTGLAIMQLSFGRIEYSVKHESLDTNVSVSCGHWRW